MPELCERRSHDVVLTTSAPRRAAQERGCAEKCQRREDPINQGHTRAATQRRPGPPSFVPTMCPLFGLRLLQESGLPIDWASFAAFCVREIARLRIAAFGLRPCLLAQVETTVAMGLIGCTRRGWDCAVGGARTSQAPPIESAERGRDSGALRAISYGTRAWGNARALDRTRTVSLSPDHLALLVLTHSSGPRK
ncbi:hypothetical protein BC834DRAFT_374035 [Gloeopeniophorella convolvens]|nr:hypothetical protein BC834DRAFT_374035 [Gloeopeniophorella convolvens]